MLINTVSRPRNHWQAVIFQFLCRCLLFLCFLYHFFILTRLFTVHYFKLDCKLTGHRAYFVSQHKISTLLKSVRCK